MVRCVSFIEKRVHWVRVSTIVENHGHLQSRVQCFFYNDRGYVRGKSRDWDTSLASGLCQPLSGARVRSAFSGPQVLVSYSQGGLVSRRIGSTTRQAASRSPETRRGLRRRWRHLPGALVRFHFVRRLVASDQLDAFLHHKFPRLLALGTQRDHHLGAEAEAIVIG